MLSKRVLALTVSGLILLGGTIGLSTGASAKSGHKTLKLTSFTNSSAYVEGGATAKFECNASTGTWMLNLNGIDVTDGSGNSFVSAGEGLYLTVGPPVLGDQTVFPLPLSQNDTNGLWQIGPDGAYAGDMPPSDCSSGSDVIIDPASNPEQAEPAGGWVFYLTGTLM